MLLLSRLEAEVKAIKEREEILENIRTLEKKKGWVEFKKAEKQIKSVSIEIFLVR